MGWAGIEPAPALAHPFVCGERFHLLKNIRLWKSPASWPPLSPDGGSLPCLNPEETSWQYAYRNKSASFVSPVPLLGPLPGVLSIGLPRSHFNSPPCHGPAAMAEDAGDPFDRIVPHELHISPTERARLQLFLFHRDIAPFFNASSHRQIHRQTQLTLSALLSAQRSFQLHRPFPQEPRAALYTIILLINSFIITARTYIIVVILVSSFTF